MSAALAFGAVQAMSPGMVSILLSLGVSCLSGLGSLHWVSNLSPQLGPSKVPQVSILAYPQCI